MNDEQIAALKAENALLGKRIKALDMIRAGQERLLICYRVGGGNGRHESALDTLAKGKRLLAQLDGEAAE